MRSLMLASLAAVLSLVITSRASADLIVNGGFEDPIDFNSWVTNPPGEFVIDSFAYSGGKSAVALSTVSNPGSLAQTVTTAAGIQYEVSFFLNCLSQPAVPYPPGVVYNFFEVYFDGLLLYREENRADDDINWERFSFTVIGNGGNQELRLVFGNEDGWFYVDDVSVAVPVPAGFIMAGIGALGLAGMHLRRRTLARKTQLA